MSNPGGCLQGLNIKLHHIGSKFCLISIWWLQRLTPCFKCFIHVKSQYREKKSGTFHWEISFSYPGIQFLHYYLSRGHLWEVKNKRQFQTFSSKGSLLQKVQNIVIWLRNFWYFGKLVTEERRSLTRGGCKRRSDCILEKNKECTAVTRSFLFKLESWLVNYI